MKGNPQKKDKDVNILQYSCVTHEHASLGGKGKDMQTKTSENMKKNQAHAGCQVVTVVDDGGNARRAPKRRQVGVGGFWQACGTKKTYLRFARSIQVPASCELPLGLCGVWGQGSVVNQKPRFIYPI